MTESGFDSRMKLKVLRTMIPEYKRHLVPSKIISYLHTTVLDEDQKKQIWEKESKSRPEAVQLLMDAVLAKKEDGLAYFIDALKQGVNNFDRFLIPLEEDRPSQEDVNHPEVNQYFEFIIRCLEGDITHCLSDEEFRELLRLLGSERVLDEGDMEELLKMSIPQRGVGLFRMMPQFTLEWPLKFFRALNKVKPLLVLKCDPLEECPIVEMNKEEAAFSSAQQDTNLEQTSPKRQRRSSKKDVEMNWEGAAFSSAQQQDFNSEQTSPKRLRRSSEEDGDDSMDEEELLRSDSMEFSDEEKEDADTEKGAQPKELSLRDYQHELASPALKGENTIICAPTGSGKTRVALHIMMKHLEGPKTGKVVFMAQTVPLVLQQFKVFEKYLPNFKCYKLHGDTVDHQDLHLMLDDFDILVMTPKILENHLDQKKLKSLSLFSLIIFDECHHTRKGDPYNSVMKHYLQFKKAREKDLPQIVGLTASIGVEKASTLDSAQSRIIEIMANLDVHSITKVKDNLEELAMTVPVPDENMDTLTPREADEVSKSIYYNMMQVERRLEAQTHGMLDSELLGVKNVLAKRPAARKSQKYGQWAVKVCDQARKVHIPQQPDDQLSAEMIEGRRLFSQNVQLLAETLTAYYEALDVHELTRPEDVLDHLKEKLDPRHSADSPAPTHMEDELKSLFKSLQMKLMNAAKARNRNQNPNLIKLSEVIEERMTGQWDSSRVMIFVRTRATCRALCSWLNTDPSLNPQLRELRASPFTGTGAHQEVGGMTQTDQEGVIDKFREGDIKLLVCTTVGQEGMDIPDCNLVIRYNHVGNEVATVQTRGRSRKAGGVSVLLAMPDVIKKEKINKKRVEIMNKAIDIINQARPREVSNRVSKAQKQAMDKDQIKKLASMKIKSSKVKRSNFTLACARCKKVCVPGSQIRTISDSHHVIIGMDLRDKGEVSIKMKERPTCVDNVQFTGEIICNKCPVMKQSVLGTILKYQEAEFLTLKAVSWLVLDEKQHVEKSGKWKWKDIRYAIPELSPADMSVHLGLPPDYEEDEDEDEDEDEGREAAGGS